MAPRNTRYMIVACCGMHLLPLFMAVSLITDNVAFDLLWHAPFVADEILGGMLEPARRGHYYISSLGYQLLIANQEPSDGLNKNKQLI